MGLRAVRAALLAAPRPPSGAAVTVSVVAVAGGLAGAKVCYIAVYRGQAPGGGLVMIQVHDAEPGVHAVGHRKPVAVTAFLGVSRM